MATKNLDTQPVPNETQSDRLLDAEESAVCQRVALGDTLDSRRAQAMLAVDGGASQAKAGVQAGLTRNQVSYCLRKFRQQGLAMFPDAALDAMQPEPAPEPVASADGEETMVEKPGKKSAKGKKSKKGKKVKKDKKKSKNKDVGKKKKTKSEPGKSSKKKSDKKGKTKAKTKAKKGSKKKRKK